MKTECQSDRRRRSSSVSRRTSFIQLPSLTRTQNMIAMMLWYIEDATRSIRASVISGYIGSDRISSARRREAGVAQAPA